MRYYLNLRTVLCLMAIVAIVQTRKSECSCGNLGSGVNPCNCAEVVVKATKVQKPLFYASPEAINQAAATRELGGKWSTRTGCGNVLFPKYNQYNGIYSTSTSSSSSSSSSNTASSSSSVASIDNFQEPFEKSSGFYHSFQPVANKVTFNSGCGCGKKSNSESLEVRDLLSHNVHGKVVPSFSPIGDLCYPSSNNEKYTKTTTKVTPAYPGKIKCSSNIPYDVCVRILNGQIDETGLRKLSQGLRGDVSALDGLYSGGVSGALNSLDKYTSNTFVDRYNNIRKYSSADNFGRYDSQKSDNLAGFEPYNSFNYAASLGQSSLADNSEVIYGTYGNSLATTQGSIGNYKSNCGAADFGDDSEFPRDFSYPQAPADPVSLTLAYKNLLPYALKYNSKTFIPEDKLAFGHRTVPIESVPNKQVLDVAEEKLQVLDKPVVELKPIVSVPITFGVYNEREEAKLAELEAIELERINQEEIAKQSQHNFITYGDLGYAPINGILSSGSRQSETQSTINAFNGEDDGTGCGPLGPPIPDYVPGNVLIDREFIENESEIEDNNGQATYVRHYLNDEISEEEDDIDTPTSGIFARLKSVTGKYPTCS